MNSNDLGVLAGHLRVVDTNVRLQGAAQNDLLAFKRYGNRNKLTA